MKLFCNFSLFEWGLAEEHFGELTPQVPYWMDLFVVLRCWRAEQTVVSRVDFRVIEGWLNFLLLCLPGPAICVSLFLRVWGKQIFMLRTHHPLGNWAWRPPEWVISTWADRPARYSQTHCASSRTTASAYYGSALFRGGDKPILSPPTLSEELPRHWLALKEGE